MCTCFDFFVVSLLKTSFSNLNLTSLPDITFEYFISVRIPDFLFDLRFPIPSYLFSKTTVST